MKKIVSSTASAVSLANQSNQKSLHSCRKTLLGIKKNLRQHVESAAQLRYLDAIKDALNTQGILERRLHDVWRQSIVNLGANSGADLKSEIESISHEIDLLKMTVKAITQTDTVLHDH